METTMIYLFAADVILFTHILLVAFIVFGLALIFVGKFRSWHWVRNAWFRIVHMLGIWLVAAQAWLGIICPLTVWEMALRAKAGDSVYSGSFVAHWLHSLLYYEAPAWVFVVCYTLFAVLVVASWFWVRPRPITGTKPGYRN